MPSTPTSVADESATSTAPDTASVVRYFKRLQDNLCRELGELEPAAAFVEDVWQHDKDEGETGGGRSRVIERGEVFEKGGVNFSQIRGAELPSAATADPARAHLAGAPFEAAGVSLVMHPRNPYVPCAHLNVRFFRADAGDAAWWFGGGYDLTPCYAFDDDCAHWHRIAKQTCARFGARQYPKFKAWCDTYFYLKHRGEARGIGGLFFDDYRGNSGDGDFDSAFAFARAVGDSFIEAYRPIVERRRATAYGKRQRRFQSHRRARYVEFNLVYDRGTLFGLQSGGRAESILMSLPPVARWRYDWRAPPGSEEQRLDAYLNPRDWA
ncbi:MAG: oxygen-dependent coproporphyrinogen oxidase [bacterium]